MARPPPWPARRLRAGHQQPQLEAMIARGKADPTATRTLRCRTVAKGRLSQLNYIRDLPPQPVMEDEPEGVLGEGQPRTPPRRYWLPWARALSVGIHANALAPGHSDPRPRARARC